MEPSVWSAIERERATGRPFAVATVVAVRGSASAKAGSRAVIDSSGRNVCGWVGGGCAESFVCAQALEAIEAGQSRVVQADLDDEVFGLGMPCGGVMDVFIEPAFPPLQLELAHAGETDDAVLHWARSLGHEICWRTRDEVPTVRGMMPLESAAWRLGRAIARARGRSFESMNVVERGGPSGAEKGAFASTAEFELLLLGRGRIVEELARLGAGLRWRVRVVGSRLERESYPVAVALEENVDLALVAPMLELRAGSAVVIASHHRADPVAIARVLGKGAAYVGLVASRKRAGLVAEELKGEPGIARVFGPTGLDLGAVRPGEIALSIVCEILARRAEASL